MPVYVYDLGVGIVAKTRDEAWEILRPISEKLDTIDVEGESTTDGPVEYTEEDWANLLAMMPELKKPPITARKYGK